MCEAVQQQHARLLQNLPHLFCTSLCLPPALQDIPRCLMTADNLGGPQNGMCAATLRQHAWLAQLDRHSVDSDADRSGNTAAAHEEASKKPARSTESDDISCRAAGGNGAEPAASSWQPAEVRKRDSAAEGAPAPAPQRQPLGGVLPMGADRQHVRRERSIRFRQDKVRCMIEIFLPKLKLPSGSSNAACAALVPIR